MRIDGPFVDSSGGEPVEGWVLSFAFDSWEVAGTVYEQARDLVFGQDIDAGVYRILLNAKAHVVVIGFHPLAPKLQHEAETLLGSFGEDIHLPEEVLLTLALRHAQFGDRG